MATIVDEYLDGQSTEGEDVFPCKGCGDVRLLWLDRSGSHANIFRYLRKEKPLNLVCLI